MKNIREHLTRNSMFSFGHCPNYLSKPSQLKTDQKFGNPTLSRIPPHCLGNLHLPIYRCTEFLDSWIKSSSWQSLSSYSYSSPLLSWSSSRPASSERENVEPLLLPLAKVSGACSPKDLVYSKDIIRGDIQAYK